MSGMTSLYIPPICPPDSAAWLGGAGAGAPGARPDKLGAGALLTAIPLARLGSWMSSAGRLALGVAVCGVGGVGGCGVCG